jgi:hypothetical protein
MKSRPLVLGGLVLGIVIGLPVGAIGGLVSSRPFQMSMENTPRTPPPYQQFLTNLARALGTDRANAGSLFGTAIGIPVGGAAGAIVGWAISAFLSGPQPSGAFPGSAAKRSSLANP